MFQQKAGIVQRRVDEEILLFDPETQEAHFLNPIAELVWDLCDGRHSEEMIAGVIVSKYLVEKEKALEDVKGLVAEFREKRLLV